MNILLAVPEYPPYSIGGGGEVYKELAERYGRNGHSITVMYGYFPNTKLFEGINVSKQNGIEFIQVPEIPYPKKLPFLRGAMPLTLKSKRQVVRMISSKYFDIAHIHGYGLLFSNFMARLCTKYNIPYIFTLHGYPESQNKYGFLMRKMWSLYIKFFQNVSLKNADALTAVSKSIANDSRNIQKDRTTVIYNGINPVTFVQIENEQNIRNLNNIPIETKIIYSIGRISAMKGFQEIIRLLPEIKKRIGSVKYIIAGDDDGYLKDLEALIRKLNLTNDVVFTGYHDNNTKKMYIKQCDFFAVPSLWEPFGMVVLEGMVFNKIILSYEVGGIKEILKNYSNKINLNSKEALELFKKTSDGDFTLHDWKTFDWDFITTEYLKIMSQSLRNNE